MILVCLEHAFWPTPAQVAAFDLSALGLVLLIMGVLKRRGATTITGICLLPNFVASLIMPVDSSGYAREPTWPEVENAIAFIFLLIIDLILLGVGFAIIPYGLTISTVKSSNSLTRPVAIQSNTCVSTIEVSELAIR